MNDIFDSEFISDLDQDTKHQTGSVSLESRLDTGEMLGTNNNRAEPSISKHKGGANRVCKLLWEHIASLANRLVHRDWRMRRNSALLLLEMIKSGLF